MVDRRTVKGLPSLANSTSTTPNQYRHSTQAAISAGMEIARLPLR